jgi:AcrR family transcriptional regulator
MSIGGGENPDTQRLPHRVDGRRNRARVLDAAEKLFSTEGRDVPISAIADRAGVGIGTIYRNFPTKTALVEAVIVHGCRVVLDEVNEIATHEPDDRALFWAFRRIVVIASSRRDLNQGLARAYGGFDPRTLSGQLWLTLETAVQDLLDRGKRAGCVRVDVDIGDLFALAAACCSASNTLCSLELILDVVEAGLRAVPVARDQSAIADSSRDACSPEH